MQWESRDISDHSLTCQTAPKIAKDHRKLGRHMEQGLLQSSHKEPNLPDSLVLDFSLQNCELVHFFLNVPSFEQLAFLCVWFFFFYILQLWLNTKYCVWGKTEVNYFINNCLYLAINLGDWVGSSWVWFWPFSIFLAFTSGFRVFYISSKVAAFCLESVGVSTSPSPTKDSYLHNCRALGFHSSPNGRHYYFYF